MAWSISLLSNEILVEILSLLPQKDLYSVNFVSKQLAGIAQPLLYRTIDLEVGKLREDYYEDCEITTQLMTALLAKPQLQTLVLKLSIKVSRPNQYEWQSPFGSHDELPRLLPQLRTLSLMPPPYNFEMPTVSPVLKTLYLNFFMGRDPRGEAQGQDPLDIIERVFWSRHLRRLVLAGVCFTPEKSLLFPASRYRTSTITDLEFLWGYHGTQGGLPDMLLCVNALQRFTFEIHTPWDCGDAFVKALEPAVLGRAVGIHASTLLTLEIAASDAAEYGDSLFGTFANYTKLKRLAILDQLLVVVGDEISTLFDVLPPSLEDLQLQFPTLTQDRDDDRAHRVLRLKQLCLVKDAWFPALKRVIWWYQNSECASHDEARYGPISDMHDLKAAFQQVGVAFEHIVTPYFSETPLKKKDSGLPWSEN